MTISRRQFVVGAGATGLLAGCGRLPWQAQPPAKVPQIGFLWLGPRVAIEERVEAFLQGLQQFGYVEGQSIAIEWRFAEGREDQLPALAGELVRLDVDVIVVPGVQAARAAKNATSTIPIVITVVSDPIGAGLVTSLARPGGNATGLSSLSEDLVSKRLELLKEVVPEALRVAILYRAGNAPESLLRALQNAAGVLGLQLQFVPVSEPDEFGPAFEAALRERVDGLQVLEDPFTIAHRTPIVDLAATRRLPVMYESRQFVEAGGLMAYGPNRFALYRRAAYYVDRILRGTKPADLPVEQPTEFEFVVNLKTARELGITFPEEIRLQVAEVIQ